MDLPPDPEEKIQCPYDRAHYVSKSRMNSHLVKCRKNFPNSKLVQCDFNVNHLFPEAELMFHYESCPDRPKMEKALYQEEGASVNKFPISNTVVPTDDCWDNDNEETYNPKEHCKKSNVIVRKDLEPAAKRKEFRKEERHKHRLISIQSQQPPDPAAAGPSTSRGGVPSADRARSSNLTTDLPERASVSIKEATPEVIDDLTTRLASEKSQGLIPKKK